MIFIKNELGSGIEVCNKELYIRKPIKAVLFDMDGVILDTEKLYVRFWREAAAYYGYNMTEEMALGMRSLNPALGEEYIKECLGMFADYQMIRNKRMQLMEVYVDKNGVEPKPGIDELLDFLKESGVKTAVATSSPAERARYQLAMVGLLNKFDFVASARMVKRGKPAPDVFWYAAEQLGVQPNQCIVLEDSPTGLLAAYLAGCVPIMVPDLDLPSEITKRKIYAVADNLHAVKEMVEYKRVIEIGWRT